jgi:ABC-2 type transport system permease protein
MKAFIGFLRKEFYHIFRDRRTLAILFGMPVVQLLLFGFAIRNELNHADLAVWDQSNDVATRAITARLFSSGTFRYAGAVRSEDDIDRLFRSGQARQVVVFEPGFAKRMEADGHARVALITDASDPNQAQVLEAAVANVIGESTPKMKVSVRMLYNPGLRSATLFVPGLIVIILMLVSTLMTSISITREKELGTMETLLASPLPTAEIIIGKVIPYLALSIVNVSTVLLLSVTVFDVPFVGSLAFFYAEAFLFATTALSLGILISTQAKTQQVAMMLSLGGLLLPTILLSGFIFPVANMPVPLQVVSHIVPARWFLEIVRGVMLKGLGWAELWQETLVLLAMTAVFIGASVKNFNTRLD